MDIPVSGLFGLYSIGSYPYVNINQVPNVWVLPLGADNFGRDMLTELVSATGTSLLIGLVAGLVATTIGLILGLMAGYIGGVVDDVVMFITNIFTVIPSFVLLILISYGIGQEQRGAVTIAAVIGFTSWVWTARAVRAQVISLRHRDHVNLSKLSGHSVLYQLSYFLDNWVETPKANASIGSGELPMDLHFMLVAFLRPGLAFGSQGKHASETATQALTFQSREFQLGHIEPRTMFRRVVPLDFVGDPPSFLGCEDFI